jgi:hypothetical protein
VTEVSWTSNYPLYRRRSKTPRSKGLIDSSGRARDIAQKSRLRCDGHPRALCQTNNFCNPGSQPKRDGSVQTNLLPAVSHAGRNLTAEMPQCETCGNEYDKAMQVTIAGESHWFDSFECAIQALAPACAHCGCKVIGHGSEAGGKFFCCAHCAKQEGVRGLDDRA